MRRCCLTCVEFGLGRCTPQTGNPLDPEYAADCPQYKEIPQEVADMAREIAPWVYSQIMEDNGQGEPAT